MISDTLTALVAAKNATAVAIMEKGGTVSSKDGFADFPDAIRAISTGPSADDLTSPASPAEILSGFQAMNTDREIMTGTLQVRVGTITPETSVTSSNTMNITHNLGVVPKIILIWTADNLLDNTEFTQPLYFGMAYRGFNADDIKKSLTGYYLPQSGTNSHAVATITTAVAGNINETSFTWRAYPSAAYGWPAGHKYTWMVIG